MIGPLMINKIMEFMPHRYPILLVDRVTEIIPKEVIHAYKCVSVNEPFFQGHFPGNPVMPGVLILEALAQAGGLLVLNSQESQENHDKKLFLFTGIEKAKFRKQVIPGDRLELECRILASKLGIWKIEGKARVDGKLAAEGILSAAIIEREDV